MSLSQGTLVDHLDFGPGKVVQSLGQKVIVDFFGDEIDCDISELIVLGNQGPKVQLVGLAGDRNRISFRRAFEAVNLGVVPPDNSSLIEMSIGGEAIEREVHDSLVCAQKDGACRVVFGDYGTGKSHYLHIVSTVARRSGWVVSYLEFDPKAVDPAKPHLVYREIMSKLQIPKRDDGTGADGFFGLIGEIRKNWDKVRDLPLFKRSPWFKYGLETLRFFPHNDHPDYISGCNWLAGQNVPVTGPGSIRELARGTTNINPKLLPNMPKVRDTAEIYVFHLAVVNQIAQALGYQGLLIVLDEAEHVRGYSVRRKERANNFFDMLARAAHPPLEDKSEIPILNDHGFELPRYWESGPHFALYIGLTEADTFAHSFLSLRDACAFLHNERDMVLLHPPTPEDYQMWCYSLYERMHRHYPTQMALLEAKENIRKISEVLRQEFESHRENAVMRTWVKLACLIPAVLFADRTRTVEDVVAIVTKAVNELLGGFLPWE
ncbi:hypothetical protein GEOBRER4_n2765 [Citrifermentans bremense]|uniref:ATP-binding protein n=1 Tax=Citrifermentans bremense TaxID=60035 RepID=A0A6S6M849_9BACT|nr:BREX system ATP-binding domain-containing protein [Citrifermentans bremense]BCG47914.1 hypothetical protein GEOBRER4_n2765 [Citrifermentans bremense]